MNKLKELKEIVEAGYDGRFNKFGFQVGGDKAHIFDANHIFADVLEDTFNKRPAVKAAIFRQLYLYGSYSSWVEGFGIVSAIDIDRHNSYTAMIEARLN